MDSHALLSEAEAQLNKLRRLEPQTLELISLYTLFLASDRLSQSIESLQQSSIRLEKLTKWLIGLTIILAILTTVGVLYH